MSEQPATPEADGPPPVPGVEIFDEAPPVPDAPAGLPSTPDTSGQPGLAHPAARAFAFALDGIGTFLATVAVVFGGLAVSIGEGLSGILWVPVASAILATVLTALWGVTPGKAIVGIKVVDAVTGGRLGWRSILRSLVIVAPLLLLLATQLVVNTLPYEATGWFYETGWPFLTPIFAWVAYLVVLALRPRHRGLQDLAGRSIVVRR